SREGGKRSQRKRRRRHDDAVAREAGRIVGRARGGDRQESDKKQGGNPLEHISPCGRFLQTARGDEERLQLFEGPGVVLLRRGLVRGGQRQAGRLERFLGLGRRKRVEKHLREPGPAVLRHALG